MMPTLTLKNFWPTLTLKTFLPIMFEAVYHYGVTKVDRHYTNITMNYTGFHRKSMEIKQKRRRVCVKIGVFNAYELIVFLRLRISSTELP